jgi:xanthine dehydrogenase accessory factor
VAHRLFVEGYAVVIHDGATPATTRRGMAFADAIFDGQTVLEGVRAARVDHLIRVGDELTSHRAIPIYVGAMGPLLADVQPAILVDARMQKHAQPDVQRGLARSQLALVQVSFRGRHADVVVETSWERLGAVLTKDASLPLAGEPRPLGGHARERYVYAPCDGVFRTKVHIGDRVRQGQEIAEIGFTVLTAPLDGVLPGLTRDGVPVSVRTKVIEVDSRGSAPEVRGIGERPRRIAAGVLNAIRARGGGGAS